MQLPIGAESDFEGVVDLIRKKACTSTAPTVKTFATASDSRRHWSTRLPPPGSICSNRSRCTATSCWRLLLGEEPVPLTLIDEVVRQAVAESAVDARFSRNGLSEQGRAAVVGRRGPLFLPSPLDCPVKALATAMATRRIQLSADPSLPTVAMAFKMVEDTLRHADVHADLPGPFVKGGTYYNQRNGRKERFSRIVRMHADQREDIDSASAGDIVAILGVDAPAATPTRPSTRTARFKACSCPSRSSRWPLHRPTATAPIVWARPCTVSVARTRLARHHRRGDQRDDHRRHGRAAPGDLHRADPPRVQRRGRGRRPQGQLPRGARRRRPSSTPGTRSRPAARANSPTSSAAWNHCPRTRRKPSCSRMR